MSIWDFVITGLFCIAFVFIVISWIRALEYTECDSCGHEFGPFDNVNLEGKNAYCDRCWKNRIRGDC